MSNGPPIPEIQHFQSLTLKIQGQGHSSRSQSRDITLSTLIPFVPCQSPVTFLGYSYFKIWHWKFKVKVICEVKVTTWVRHSVDSHPFRSMWIGHPIAELRLFQNLTLKIKGQGHRWGHSSKSLCGCNILSTYIPFVPRQSGIPFLSYDFFKIWPWKSRVKVMGEVTLQSHNVGLTSYRLIFLSLHVNRPSHSWDTAFFKIWPWKSRVKVKRPWCCTTTGPENSIELRMV